MSRRKPSERKVLAVTSRLALGAAVCLICLWPFHRVPSTFFAARSHRPPVAIRRPRRRGEVVATRLHGSRGFPFVVYHAFCAERDGCSTLTFVGQIEGECYARRETLERAGLDHWLSWRQEFAAETPNCAACVASKTVSRIKRSMDAATKAVFGERNSPGAYRCGFYDQGGRRVESTFAATEIPKRMAKFRSTVIFTCDVPPSLAESVLESRNDVKATLILKEKEYAPLDIVVQRNLTTTTKTQVAACAWVKGGSYDDRTGKGRALPSSRIAEWIAHHRAIGVDHFAIFDNSEGVYRRALEGQQDWMSPLSDVLKPLETRQQATHVPWPSLVQDEVLPGCSTADLEKRVTRATNGTKTTQSFFGRPSQYAAQNACHLRMVAAGASAVLHVDVDEFVIPRLKLLKESSSSESDDLPPLVRLANRLDDGDDENDRKNPVALAMPCIFYGPCPRNDDAVVGTNASRMLLEDATCAGKASMYRQKLLASRRAEYLWVHYVRSGSGGQVEVLSNKEVVLAHLRPGYSLATAESSRAIDAKTPSDAEETEYARNVRPRFLPGGPLCSSAAETSAKRHSDHTTGSRQRGRSDYTCERTDTGLPWGWCWCRDDLPARHWSRVARNQMRSLWGDYFSR